MWLVLVLGCSLRLISGQRHDANGTKVGGEKIIGDLGYVTVWYRQSADGSGWGVHGRRFNAAGNPAGGEFQINVDIAGSQVSPPAAARSDGGFVVAWNDVGDIATRVYDAKGSSGADVFDINAGGGRLTLFNTGHGSDGA